MANDKGRYRDATVTIVMGKNGTGKSTLAHKIVKKIGGKTLIVTMNGAPEIWRQIKPIDVSNPKEWQAWKTGFRHCYWMIHEKETFNLIHQNGHNLTLVLDDCRAYIPSRLDQDNGLKRLLIDFRHRMIDIFFVVHSPTQVPRQVWSFYSYAWVGATDQLFDKSSISVDSGLRIFEAQKEVNEKFRLAREKNDGSHYGIFRLVKA